MLSLFVCANTEKPAKFSVVFIALERVEMPITIRRALPQDAQAIAGLIAASFQEEANPAHIQALIEEAEHLTFVAEDEEILGLIDGFYTPWKWELRRLELDLLAVHPEHSGKGIGKALIRKFTESQENAALIRALVAVNNKAMQHAMTATDYKQRWNTSSLYIATDGNGSQQDTEDDLIPVKTFTYTGVWIDSIANQENIEAAQFLRQNLGYDIVGRVADDILNSEKAFDTGDTIPISEELLSQLMSETQLLLDEGFRFVKQFHWWTYEILSKEKLIDYLKHWEEEHGDNQ
jgi:GNAT superfamily N-acetyltransferase